jgi:hypothetical protein
MPALARSQAGGPPARLLLGYRLIFRRSAGGDGEHLDRVPRPAELPIAPDLQARGRRFAPGWRHEVLPCK